MDQNEPGKDLPDGDSPGLGPGIPGPLDQAAETDSCDSDSSAAVPENLEPAAPAADPADPDEGYVAMLREYLVEQESWITPALRPLVFHLRRLGQRLDADPDAPVAMSSAYLQAFSRLDKNRPGHLASPGDGLVPPGAQPSIFDEMP